MCFVIVFPFRTVVRPQSAKTSSWLCSAHLAEALAQLCVKRAGCSKPAKWSHFFSSLSPLRRAFGRRLLQRRTPGPTSGQARPRRHSCRANSTTCTAASEGNPLASPPKSPDGERGEVEVAPGGPHRLVAAVVDEVCAEYPLAVAEEHVVAVPFMTPKSTSKLSVMVYQGISQPIRAFRRAISACGVGVA